jgi:hypothetical protein
MPAQAGIQVEKFMKAHAARAADVDLSDPRFARQERVPDK